MNYQKYPLWLISLIVPFFLLMTTIRILITPLFLEFEYRTPGFPIDTYGFNLEDRLKWAKVSENFLVNSTDITFLSKLRFPDGTPLYNERELSHMIDVKSLIQTMLFGWYIIISILIISALWAWRSRWIRDYLDAISRGGKFTIILIVIILVGVILNFNTLFTGFHQIFFKGDTWIFLYSDTLIRLFPMRFWQDTFIWMGILTISGALLCILMRRKFVK